MANEFVVKKGLIVTEGGATVKGTVTFNDLINGFLKVNASGVVSVDTNTYALSSHTHAAGDITSGTFGAARFTGTATEGYVLKLVSGVPTWSAGAAGADGNTFVTGSTFNNGTLTLTRNDNATVTVSLDGRYAYSSHTHTEYVAKAGDTMTGDLAVGSGTGFSKIQAQQLIPIANRSLKANQKILFYGTADNDFAGISVDTAGKTWHTSTYASDSAGFGFGNGTNNWLSMSQSGTTFTTPKLLIGATATVASENVRITGDVHFDGLLRFNTAGASNVTWGYSANGIMETSSSTGIRSGSGSYYADTFSSAARLYVGYYGSALYAGQTPNQNGRGLAMDITAGQSLNGYDSRALHFGYTVTSGQTGNGTFRGGHFYVTDNSTATNTLYGVSADVSGGSNPNATRLAGYFVGGGVKITNSTFLAYTSGGSSNDALKISSASTGAAFGVQNTAASGFSGIEYIGSDNAIKVFTGYNNGTAGEFRFNNLATSGHIRFMINGSDGIRINNNRTLQFAGYASAGFFKSDASGNVTVDTNTYLTTTSASGSYLAKAGDTASGTINQTALSASSLSDFATGSNIVGGLHFMGAAGGGSTTRNQQAITWSANATSNTSQAGIYVTNDGTNGTMMTFATTNSYATGPQRALTLDNYGVVSFNRYTAAGYLRNDAAGKIISDPGLGVLNTVASTGSGISLYNGPQSGQPTYGLMFAGTPTFGTHGSVTGDWATYFTMNNDGTRGWIFKSNSGTAGNVASISGNGYITANKFILSGGTSAQFLKADGSVDSNTYSLSTHNHDGTYVKPADTFYIGTTQIAHNRGSAAQTLNGVSIDGLVLSTTGQLKAYDNAARVFAPSAVNPQNMQFVFVGYNNTNGSPYADGIIFRSYMDGSGGSDNMLTVSKGGFGIRQWQQTFGSATAFSSYKSVLFSDGTYDNGTSAFGTGATQFAAGNHTHSNYVPTSRIITINGTAYDLSADRSWTIAGGSSLTINTNADNRLLTANGTTTSIDAEANLTWNGSVLQAQSATTSITRNDMLRLLPSDYGAGKPGLYFTKTATATVWDIGLWDGAANTGTVNFMTNATIQGQQIYTTGYATTTGTANMLALRDGNGGVSGASLGIDNSSPSTGKGISLYSGAVAGYPQYGIFFGGTGSFGTHGSVTGDWATYFTMSNTNTRGWIFKSADAASTTGNVASISCGGNMTLGASGGGSTATPVYLTMGTSFADTVGSATKTKLRLYENGTTIYGFGVSSSALEYHVPTGGYHSFFTAGAEKMRQTGSDLHVVGDIIGYSTSISDASLKTNVQPLSGSLDKVKQLRGVTFQWKTDRKGTDMGFIAQEVETVVPEVVREKETLDGVAIKTVQYQNMVALLVEAMKEQQAQIEQLQQELNDLKSKL